MKDLKKKWWFWGIILLIVIVICFTIFMLYALKLATEGINEVALKVQEIDKETTLYSSAGHNIVIVEMPNYTEDAKKEKVELIKKTIYKYAQNGNVLSNYEKFIMCNKINSETGIQDYLITNMVFSLPDMIESKEEGSVYVDLAEMTKNKERITDIYNFEDTTVSINNLEKTVSNSINANSTIDTNISTKKPDNIELMTYAQTVLKDNLSKPKYSSNKSDYTFINTGLRYKIEGDVTINGNKEKFYMIIEFVDDTYEEYDLISLQVGNKKIH